MADPTPKTKSSKKSSTAARAAGAACFRVIMKQNQPNLTKEQRQAAWAASKEEYFKLGGRIIKGLKRRGFKVVKSAMTPARRSARAAKRATA